MAFELKKKIDAWRRKLKKSHENNLCNQNTYIN